MSDARRLDSRHALVTGAGRGIGRSCALALAELGASVTLVARSGDELELWPTRSASWGLEQCPSRPK